MKTLGRNDVSLMLDSGAFSAWMKEEEISVHIYGDFVMEQVNNFDLIVNLDVIPGKFGEKNLSKKVLEESVQQGLDNYDVLVSMGVPKNKLIHVFHQGESFKILEMMAVEMEYIGISPANDRTTKEKKIWLDQCMKYVLNSDGSPKVKFHGFGMTSLRLIWRYPWFSVDSTTWVLVGAMGGVLMPKSKYGKITYREPPIIIPITTKNDVKKSNHFQNLSGIEQSKVTKYFDNRGFDVETLATDGLERDRTNMKFFLEMEKTLDKTKMYFAGNFPMLHKIEREFKTMDMALTISDKYRRLGSYYHKSYLLKLLKVKQREV